MVHVENIRLDAANVLVKPIQGGDVVATLSFYANRSDLERFSGILGFIERYWTQAYSGIFNELRNLKRDRGRCNSTHEVQERNGFHIANAIQNPGRP
jgi:hypothetical protein